MWVKTLILCGNHWWTNKCVRTVHVRSITIPDSHSIRLNTRNAPGACPTVLSWASTHPRASAHPSILTVFQGPSCNSPQNFCVVTWKLTVWAHIDCSCDHSDEFQVPLQSGSKVCTHRSKPRPQRPSLAVQNLRITSNEHCEALATRLRVGLFLAGYSFPYCCAVLVWLRMKHGRSYDADQFSSACQLTSDPGWAFARE